jgi:acyl carrier protein
MTSERTRDAVPEIAPAEIEQIVLDAIRNANRARSPERQLAVAADAALFGNGSSLDSLGLVALVIDIEEAFADRGIALTLSDERAMSQHRNPFRTVSILTAHISARLAEGT